MNETIVIYHGGCRDGFCAAWVVNKYLTEHYEYKYSPEALKEIVTYHAGFYGQEPPDCKDKDVIIVDFSYQLEIMEKIIQECKSLIWLDHHKTAEDTFKKVSYLTKAENRIYDSNRSGAGIAWDYFFPNEPRPWIVDYVEDRDLWNKKLENSDWVNAYISVLEFDFKVWDAIAGYMILEQAVENGIIAEAKTEQYVREVCKNVYFINLNLEWSPPYESKILELKKIPTVNICQVDCSEVLHELCKIYPKSLFSLYWFKRQDGMYQYGLRSIGDFDVSTVAKLFGGGGHKNAAGFQLNYLLEELK